MEAVGGRKIFYQATHEAFILASCSESKRNAVKISFTSEQ